MIYIHVPFCESFCTYCGFFSVRVERSCFEDYADAVVAEIEERREEIARTSEVNTLYIGGGTPSVLPLNVLSRIVQSLQVASGRLPDLGDTQPQRSEDGLRRVRTASRTYWREFTMEVNPEDIVEKGEEYVRGLKELGVDRVSMGVQSFDDGILKWMNRRHDAAKAEEAFRILRRSGIGNISIDLIFGLSQLDDATWISTIEKALSLKPEHISAYQLSVEEDSALEELIAKGKYEEASDEQCRRQYDILCGKLGEAGYRHYEISNFALPGFEAVHNSAYWRRVPYVGLGPGAHSLSPTGVRSWNSQEIPRRLRNGYLLTYSSEEETLTPEDIRVERIMLPLRTDRGLPEAELRSLAGDGPIDRLLAEGSLIKQAHRSMIRIPEDHFFVSDDIIRELI